MADHLITRTLTSGVIQCGNWRCGKSWQQLVQLDGGSDGWNVCPHCLWAAPTNVSRDALASPRDLADRKEEQ